MQRGRKADPPSQHLARGTYQPARHADTIEIIAPDALPQQPEWLTEAGRQVWLDNIGRISSVKTASELDSDFFGQYCNLQGANSLAWAAGQVPPISALDLARKMLEQLGLGGSRSRVKLGSNGAKPTNPYLAPK